MICMSKITDTSKQSAELNLLEAMDAGLRTGNPSNAILEQEARGQEELVAAKGVLLPASGLINDNSCGWHHDITKEELWAAHSVQIGEPVEGDEIWVNVKLPWGWKIEATDHSMWSKLVDNKGRSRAAIFYKAAFYDRECFIQPEHRYSASTVRDGRDRNSPHYGVVLDGDKEIHRTGPLIDDKGERPSGHSPEARAWKSSYEKSLAASKAWLDQKYPRWNDLTAYWNS